MIPTSEEYSKFYLWTIAGICLVYVIVSFGLSGLPSVSRLSLYSSFLLFFLLLLSIGKLQLPSWLIIIFLFYLYMALPALALDTVPTDKLGTFTVALLGTASFGLAIYNKMLSYKVLAYGALVAAIINLLSIHYYGMGITPEEGRYAGLLGNPNSLSIKMAFAAFLICLIPERFSWPVKTLGILVAVYGMYISGSRKGILLVAALLTMVFMDHLLKLSKVKILLYITGITASVITFYGLLAEFAARYTTKILAVDRTLQALAGHESSYGKRIYLIDVGLKLWEKSPLFGFGFDQFSVVSNLGSYAHNNYIELAVSGGIIALLLFYSLHVNVLCNAMKQPYGFRLRLVILILTLVLMDMAVVSFYDKAEMCMLGILLALSSVKHQEVVQGSLDCQMPSTAENRVRGKN